MPYVLSLFSLSESELLLCASFGPRIWEYKKRWTDKVMIMWFFNRNGILKVFMGAKMQDVLSSQGRSGGKRSPKERHFQVIFSPLKQAFKTSFYHMSTWLHLLSDNKNRSFFYSAFSQMNWIILDKTFETQGNMPFTHSKGRIIYSFS